MSDIQDWCKEILPVINAAASGESIQVRPIGGDCWGELRAMCIRGDMGLEYRIKPRTIKIGDFDVPEPITNHPAESSTHVYIASPAASSFYDEMELDHSVPSYVFAERGICHKTKDAAIVHSKAIISLASTK